MFIICPARADLCRDPVNGGTTICDAPPTHWTDCGQTGTGQQVWCYPNAESGKHHSKKKHDSSTMLLVSVAAGAVFIGAMWYFFKKPQSETNPGQVKFAEF